MLGVFKRRWKAKRSANVSRIPGDPNTALDATDKEKPPSRRQVHPVLEDKTLLGYDTSHLICADLSDMISSNGGGGGGGSPPPYPKRASLESNYSPPQCYPLAPNICVEAGRIQFIRQDTEGAVPEGVPTPKSLVSRAQQTNDSDEMKNLENRIEELETLLETAHRAELRDKQTISKLQKQLGRRESAQRDADRERRLRADSESRAKQALQEAARCRSRLKLLTAEFSRMEETVRTMFVYKKQAEQLRQEKSALTLAYENRCQQYQTTISRLNNEIVTLRQQLSHAGILETNNNPEEEVLEAKRHAEESRKQYERCLDDVANQVVRALLAQKGLREEVGVLNGRIQELESQNRALTSMLVHQLRGETPYCEVHETTSITSPLPEIVSNKVKHCNSFNSEVLVEECSAGVETALSKFERRLSANSDILDSRFSLADKKRHQVLTKLWTELKGAEVTPRKLFEALNAVDSALWVPPKRPVSLNLPFPIVQTTTKYKRTRPVLTQTSSKSEEETTGNESPESGNRDEGYSTMSSDVQADLTRTSGEAIAPSRGLEDLKEATDETDLVADTSRLLSSDSTNHNQDADILYIPLNLLSLNLKSRNSYPPGRDMLPFQHIMRSFSDSHLCIKITATTPSPCYTFSSTISSSPSIYLLDLSEKNPLRRTRATSALWTTTATDYCDETERPYDDCLECTGWDADYIQQWLRLDETRSALQQQRDLLELEYDRAELEDWSLSLSSDDLLREQFKNTSVLTPGQISIATLPSIQENNALELVLELEEDSNECLWNNSSYLMDKEGRELMTLLMDNPETFNEKSWPYQQVSPSNSWSGGSDEPETCSKRSSACSDDTGELPAIGTDFTRDFYRLVKFESTKSLASTSSRSVGGENGDTVHQKTVKEFNITPDDANYVTLKQLCEEYTMNEQNHLKDFATNISYASEVCLVTPLDVESENCSMISEQPVDICTSVSVELSSTLEESTSSVSTPDTVVSKIPRRKQNSKIPLSPAKKLQEEALKLPKSRIPHKQKIETKEFRSSPQHVITSEKLPKCSAGVISNIIDGPPHRAVSFHERATSKDVIDELNRMIKNGEENAAILQTEPGQKLDQNCQTTGWIHVEKDIDLTDPKARANLLDVMMASVSSDSSPTSSCGGSVASDSTEDPPDYGHLHRIHRFHRQKKAKAVRPALAVVRASSMAHQPRPTVVGRPDLFVRYGQKEIEAVASFDFLDDFATNATAALFAEDAPDNNGTQQRFKVTQV